MDPRIDKLYFFFIGLLSGIVFGLLISSWFPTDPIGPSRYGFVEASEALVPDIEALPEPEDPLEVSCECIQFVEEVEGKDRVNGTLCRCDDPDVGIMWIFEGKPAGLQDLYKYLEEGVEAYYQHKQEQRWPRPH